MPNRVRRRRVERPAPRPETEEAKRAAALPAGATYEKPRARKVDESREGDFWCD